MLVHIQYIAQWSCILTTQHDVGYFDICMSAETCIEINIYSYWLILLLAKYHQFATLYAWRLAASAFCDIQPFRILLIAIQDVVNSTCEASLIHIRWMRSHTPNIIGASMCIGDIFRECVWLCCSSISFFFFFMNSVCLGNKSKH